MGTRKWKIRYLRLVRRVHRLVSHPRLRHREWWKPVRASLTDRRLWHPCRDTVANGVSIGLFFAMMPMPGQSIAAATIAARYRANIPFAVGSTLFTNPFTSPLIRPLQYKVGGWLRENLHIPMPHLGEVDLQFRSRLVELNVSDFILGFLVTGIVMALLAFPVVHLFSALLPHHLPIRPVVIRKRKSENSSP
ncbi:DUF2062 domain-containing protein [Haloferula sargassicola]|uniref:DUF2062 domain-containing protein n=1 Tax=Haloferula sargassicola TaxID=490096 RepID=A0ABP9UQ00_9BACT